MELTGNTMSPSVVGFSFLSMSDIFSMRKSCALIGCFFSRF